MAWMLLKSRTVVSGFVSRAWIVDANSHCENARSVAQDLSGARADGDVHDLESK
jgi:hypothetical protein